MVWRNCGMFASRKEKCHQQAKPPQSSRQGLAPAGKGPTSACPAASPPGGTAAGEAVEAASGGSGLHPEHRRGPPHASVGAGCSSAASALERDVPAPPVKRSLRGWSSPSWAASALDTSSYESLFSSSICTPCSPCKAGGEGQASSASRHHSWMGLPPRQRLAAQEKQGRPAGTRHLPASPQAA